jgi:hypothetical protein
MSQGTSPNSERQAAQQAIFADIGAVLSTTSKWLIASLGAIGAVLVAGSQLSSLGSLPIGPRFFTAVASASVALTCVLVAILLVTDLVAPERCYISEVSREWTRYEAKVGRGTADGPSGVWHRWRAQRKYPVSAWFAEHPEYLAGFASPKAIYDDWRSNEDKIQSPDVSAEEQQQLVELSAQLLASIDLVIAMANFRRNRTKFQRLRVPLAGLMTLAAVGIGIFAWAANPAEKGPASFRNADLTGADLSGAFLGYADFTGADLTDADLRGANLTGAKLTDVTWDSTVCPDGTNSDDVGKSGEGGTCEGHLVATGAN